MGQTAPSASSITSTTIPTMSSSNKYLWQKQVIDFTDTDYSNYLGFKWERELAGMTPVGINGSDSDFNTIGKTGGEKEHTLKVEEIPKHSHKTGISSTTFYSGAIGYDTAQVKVEQTSGLNTASTGGDKPHNNMQPYKVVAYWKRVA